MKIVMTSVFVDDQQKALDFYTNVLGFIPKDDVDLGEFRWLSVASPDLPDGVQLLLEPDAHPAVAPFKQAIVADGIPFASFEVSDIDAEYTRLVAAGVVFTQPVKDLGGFKTAIFEDTCGNLIQIAGH